ncbi:MAG: hypothetical protein U9R64_12200 [Pseudomonadota bacterium]|nr:hypothetical protein [Pseudomonadota bacterium]
MRAWLIQIDAWDGATPYPVRMASHDDERLCHLDGKAWWPVIARLPTLRYDFFDGGFDAGAITSPSGELEAAIEAIPALPALAIHDARIRIWGGALGDGFDAFTLKFDGRVKEQPTVDTGTASISFGADDGWLDQPLLATYKGTGGAEGGPDLEGQVKPLALGAPRFAPATLIDAVDNIYQLSGYGPIGFVETIFERLNRFGGSSANVADFAALKSATIAKGQWATCLAAGLVRFGAPPEGMLAFHLAGDSSGGWSRLPGDIIRRIATIAGHVDRVAAGDVVSLNAARPWPLSILVTAQTTARDLIQRIAMSVNAVAYVDWLGVLRLAPLAIGAPSVTLAADGSSLPPVADVQQVSVSAPFWKIAQGAAVTWQVHGLNDIAFDTALVPRGGFDAGETYRRGDIVTMPDGSSWLYDNDDPSSGQVPPIGSEAGNQWWKPLSPGLKLSDIEGALDLIEQIAGLGDDGVLTVNEKITVLIPQDVALERAWQTLSDIALAFGIGTERTDAIDARAAWIAYRNALNPAWNDTDNPTDVDRALFRQRIDAYDTALKILQKAISDAAGKTALWGGVSGPGRPADNADVTGDNVSKDTNAVSGRPASEVIFDLNLNGQNWFAMASLEATRDALMLARTSLDGVPIGTVVSQFKAEQTTANSATAENFTLLGAKAGDGLSWNLNIDTVRVGPVGGSGPSQSLAQRFSSISASLGENSGAINDLREVIVDAGSGVTAKAVLGITVDSGGRKLVSGMVLTNDGTLARLELLFNAYNFLTPSGASIFNYSDPSVGGDGRLYMGNVVVDTFAARSIATEALALFAGVQPYFTQLASDVTLTNAVEVNILSLTITKRRGDSAIDLLANIRLESSDDIRGTFRFYQDGTLIDTMGVFMNGAGGTFRISQPVSFFVTGGSAGSQTYRIAFVRNGGASVLLAKAGSNLKITEIN